jgi:NitT/TauT family transport system ATP-binding protein
MSEHRTHREALAAAEPEQPKVSDGERIVAEFRHVCADFADAAGGGIRRVLSDISLPIREGEFLVLVGKSGSGKTTLLNMLAGLIDATEGEVSVLGRPPREMRQHLGYMFARDALLPWRTAEQNVLYGLEIRGVPRKRRVQLAREYLEMVGLRDVARLWPWQLSQGMRQRVALARTWALEPSLLLLDEPFAALDAHTREVIQQEFLRFWEEHRRTVVFVTHDLSEAIGLGDRVVLVGEGQLLREMSIPFSRPRNIEEISSTPEFQRIRSDLRRHLEPSSARSQTKQSNKGGTGE